MRNIDPSSEENERASRDNEIAVKVARHDWAMRADPRDGKALTPRMAALLAVARNSPGGRVRLYGSEIQTGIALERRGLGVMNGCQVQTAFVLNAEGGRS